MHVTSPIRRFVDLITQQQLKKLIKKEEPVFTSEDMMRWSEGITLRQRKYNRAEKIILQYWKFRYLQQNKQELFEAKVRKQLSNNNTEIELLELDCIVQVSGLRGYEEEEQIILKINEVSLDPLKLIVRAMKSVTEDVNVHRLEGKTA
jgi:exoribonuclease R